MKPAGDSAGRSFAGRAFSSNDWSHDDGGAPPGFLDAVAELHAGPGSAVAVLDALRAARLLVPLVADAAEATLGAGAHRAELALPTVVGPDGRPVLPAFSSAAAMRAWRPAARPVPAPARQVALGAAADGTELVVVDPGSSSRFGLRRSAVEALARDAPWRPPWLDDSVLGAVRTAAEADAAVDAARVLPGDPGCTLETAELVLVVVLRAGSRPALVAERIRERVSAAPEAAAVDSLAVRVLAPDRR